MDLNAITITISALERKQVVRMRQPTHMTIAALDDDIYNDTYDEDYASNNPRHPNAWQKGIFQT
jgi:hypothetical protein